MRIQNLKKNVAVFLHVSSTILNHSQSALHVTDDSRIKILYKTPKVWKHLEGGPLVAIPLLNLMTHPKSLYEKTSQYTSFVGSKRSVELSINFNFQNVIFQSVVFPFVWARYKWKFVGDSCNLSFPPPFLALLLTLIYLIHVAKFCSLK